MEQENAKNGKGSMIMMSTMIWVSLIKKLAWLVQFLEETAVCLTHEGGDLEENQLGKVRLLIYLKKQVLLSVLLL